MLVDPKMQIAKFQMQNEKWRKRSHRHFAFCIEHFAFCIPPRRSGLSLTEVLIAMGILTLGLLGVASVFPVGSFYMLKADISDKGSAIAQSVLNDIVSRGMLNPRAWFVMTPIGAVSPYNTTFPSDAKYNPNGTLQRGTFTRSFALALNEALSQPTATTDRTVLARQFGSAFVIDPLGVSYLAFRGTPPAKAPIPAAVFPATAYNGFANYAMYDSWGATAPWAPWYGGSKKNYDGYEWPVRRVTFRQPSTGWQMDSVMAGHYFRGNDDLAVDLPPRDDRPAAQDWEIVTDGGGNKTPLARQSVGDYSWIVTVSPSSSAARDGMATNPEGFAYDVSVVVFYRRVLPDSADSVYLTLGSNNAQYLSAMGANERAVKANVVSTGLNGGELLLTDWNDVVDTNNKPVGAFDQLKTGQWIMLCGPHPNSSTSEPRLVLNWYQVLSIDSEKLSSMYGYDATKQQRAVALRGPQWPWQPPSSYGTNAASNLCVAICQGAVAVHTKTMRLEGRNSPRSIPAGGASGSGGGDGAFGGGGNPGSTAPPYSVY